MTDLQLSAIQIPSSPLQQYFIGEVYSKASFWTKKAWASDAGRDEQIRNAAQADTRAIRLDFNFLQAYEHRTSDYLNLKRYPEALRDYEKILALDPDNAAAYSDRGLARFETGAYVAAIIVLTQNPLIQRISLTTCSNASMSYAYRTLSRADKSSHPAYIT